MLNTVYLEGFAKQTNKQTKYFGNEFFLETVNVLQYIYSELFNTSLH